MFTESHHSMKAEVSSLRFLSLSLTEEGSSPFSMTELPWCVAIDKKNDITFALLHF